MRDRRTRLANLTAEEVRELLHYDPDTGILTWLKRGTARFDMQFAGKQAGCVHYRPRAPGSSERRWVSLMVKGTLYHAPRIIWLYVHGRWPIHHIDHKNGDSTDNRLCNLREATSSQNSCNSRAKRGSAAGLKGVTKHLNGWKAAIRIHGKSHYLGRYKPPEEAHEAYRAAATRLHGEFARFE